MQALDTQLTEAVKRAEAIRKTFQTTPFDSEIASGMARLSAAEATQLHLASHPARMTPEEIIAGLAKAGIEIATANIELDRASSKLDSYLALVETQVGELASDTLPLINQTVAAFESRVKAELIEIGGGYWHEYNAPLAVVTHRSAILTGHARIVDGRGFAPSPPIVKLHQIQLALASCKTHLS